MIATLLRYFRNLHNLKQKTVADLLGMSQANYSDLENGKTKLSYTAAEKLAMHYGVTSSQLYTDSSSETDNFTNGIRPHHTVNFLETKKGMPPGEKNNYEHTMELLREEIKELTIQLKYVADLNSCLLKRHSNE